MGMEERLLKAYKESVEHLESISALELMQRTGLFINDLHKLVNCQHLSPTIIIGCLMTEVHRLNSDTDEAIQDERIIKSFELFKRYAEEKFMKKE